MAREIWVQSQAASHQRFKKMVINASWFNTHYYKVRIKGKGSQSWESSSALSYTSV